MNNPQEIWQITLRTVAAVMSDLEKSEILALYMTGALHGNRGFESKLGYEKIKPLLNTDGTMHEETFKAFMAIAGSRIEAMRGQTE